MNRSRLERAVADFRRDGPRPVEGARLRVLDRGSGDRAFVLLPGYFVGALSLAGLTAELAGSRRVLAVEYGTVRTMDELAIGLTRAAEAAGVRELDLVGHSIGALYARALALRFGERVRSLTLCHGSLPRSEDAARVRRGNLLGALAPTFVHRRQWKQRIAGERAADDPITALWRELYLERAGEVPRGEFLAWGAAYLDLLESEAPTREAFDAWGGRVLVVDADDDPVIGASEREALRVFHAGAEHWNAAGTGHGAPELAPDKLAERLLSLAV